MLNVPMIILFALAVNRFMPARNLLSLPIILLTYRDTFLIIPEMRRVQASEITLFESQGLALEDVAVGMLVYRRAREEEAGAEVAL